MKMNNQIRKLGNQFGLHLSPVVAAMNQVKQTCHSSFYRIRSQKNSKQTFDNLGVMFETMEPRVLLSADLGVGAAVLTDGITQLDDAISDFFSDSLLNTPLPLLIESETIGESLVSGSPNIADLLAVDITNITALSSEIQTLWNGFDTDDDKKVTLDEFFTGVTSYFDSAIDDAVLAAEDATTLAASLSGDLDQTFSIDTAKGSVSVGLNVDVTNQSDNNKLLFDTDISLTTSIDLALDIGAQAELADFSLDASSTISVESIFNIDFDFGVFTSGETPAAEDFFISVEDLSANLQAQDLDFDVEVKFGFLGASIVDGSITFNAGAEVTIDSPANLSALGFDTTATNTNGSLIAGLPPGDVVLTDDVTFHLRIGDGDTKTVTLDASVTELNTTLEDLANDLRGAINSAGLSELINVSDDGTHLILSSAAGDASDLGFSGDIDINSSSQTAALAPVFDTDFDFLISVNNALPQVVNVTGAANIAALVVNINTALNSKGLSASVVADDNGGKIRLVTTDSIQISNVLTIESVNSIQDLTAANALSFDGNVNGHLYELNATLPITVDTGLGFTPAGLELSVDVDDSNMSLDGDRFDFDLGLTSPNFDDLLNFQELSPAKIISLLGQLADFMDGFANSDIISGVEIPFANADLGDVLDFGDMIKDSLLFDDGDDGVDEVGDLTPNDVAKLLDENNAVTFDNAQELAVQFAAILGIDIGDIGANYNALTDELTYTLVLGEEFTAFDVDASFDFDLAPLAEFTSSSRVSLSGEAGLSITLGISLGDVAGSVTLDNSTELSSLRTPVDIKQDYAITAENNILDGTDDGGAAISGFLNANATFNVDIDGTVTSVTVLESLASTNRNVLDLVRDVNTALETADLDNSIVASSVGKKLVFTEVAGSSVDEFTITATNTIATDELGLVSSATANLNDLIVTLSDGAILDISLNSATDIGGVLTAIGDASLDLDISINADGTRLILTDNSAGGGVFSAVTTNASLAGIQLGIIGFNDGSDTSVDDLIIQGASIAGATLSDRFFIEQATASGEINLNTTTTDLDAEENDVINDIDVTARFGFVDVSLTGDGSATASISAGLKAVDGVAGSRITLTDLMANLGNITDIVAAPVISGSGSLDLALEVSPDFTDIALTGGSPSVSLNILDFGDPLAGTLPTIDVQLFNLDELAKFDNIGFSQILDGLVAVSDFLEQFEAFGFLNEDIPLINLSVNDMLAFADRFDTAVQSAQDNPAGTLQSLEQVLKDALGIEDSDSDAINLDLDGDVLKFELGLGAEFSEALGVDFDLSSYIADLNLDPALEELLSAVNLAGSAGLVASGDVGFDLDFGIDLGFDATNDLGDLYIYDSTGIAGNLLIGGENLSFRGALGPVGLFVNNYTDENGVVTEAEILIDGAFSADLNLNGEDKVLLDLTDIGTFISDNAETSLTGTAVATLPVFLPTDSNFAGVLSLNADLTDLSNVQVSGLGDILSSFDPTNLSLFDNMLLAVDGIDFVLEGVQDLLDGALGEISLPLIGDGLADGAGFIEDFREDVIEPFRLAVENLNDPDANAITLLLNDAFGSILKDGTTIVMDTNLNDAGVELNETFMQWNLVLGESTMLDAGIDFDIGLPGLGIETEGEIDVVLGWEFAFGFGLSVAEGFYFDISDNSELELNVDVTTPGAAISGQLAFLGLTAQDKESEEGEFTHLGATFAIDVVNRSDAPDATPEERDKRLGFSELGQLGINTGIAAEAIVSLGFDLKVEGVDVFPDLSADFYLDWSVGDRDGVDPAIDDFIQLGDLSSSLLMEGLELVEFRDVTLDLGSYIDDVIAPVLDTINDVLEPLEPIIDFLTAPLPVISDLGADLTLLDIAAAFGTVDTSFINSVADIIELIDLIDSFSAADEGGINFGDFAVFDINALGDTALNIDLSDARANLTALKDKVVNEATTQALPSTSSSAGAKLIAGDGFAFPILTDPSQIFGLLLGNTADLVTYDFGTLALDFSYTQFFPIFGPLGASITGQIGALIDFDFGFDTLGIQQFAEGNFTNPELIFNGFYIDDLDDNGVDVAEVIISGGFSAAAELNLGIARGGVAGGVFVDILFDLFDPDHDGKVRIEELVGNIINEVNFGSPVLSPLAIFDISGEITARLFAFVEVDLFFFSIDFEEDIVDPITILEFGTDFFRPPSLATELANGDLQINIGNFSELRLNGDLRDLNETISVAQDGSGGVKIWSDMLGISFANAQQYDVTGTIIAQGGEGNDIIDMSAVTGNYTYNVEGGVGNDIIILGSGSADGSHVEGGLGNDTIFGSNGIDTLIGSLGNDEIHGRDGNDQIFGDAVKLRDADIRVRAIASDGKDRLFGDGGHDLIVGGGNDDAIEGGAGNDTLVGDGAFISVTGATINTVEDTNRGIVGGADTIDGGDNNDTIYGGKGDDTLIGGNHNDHIYGESGFDRIFGDNVTDNGDISIPASGGTDTLYGGDDNDVIQGGAGIDHIYGDAGADEIYGGTGDDVINGNRGADTIYGNSGEDNILGGSDPDLIYGGNDDDTIDGEQGADTIYGNDGDDDVFSYLGSDFIDGNAGADEFFVYNAGSDSDKRVEVFDSGLAAEGADELTVSGTELANEFLLRAGTSEDGIGFVAMINPDETLERTDYDGNLESLVVLALGGNDRFAIDDNKAITRIEGGAGEDFFQIGQMYNTLRTQELANILEVGDEFASIETTVGFLSNGISLPMTINGGSNNDTFSVFHNKAVLTLNGDDGNDEFMVRAFALAGSQEDTRNRTDISGGSDADLIQYAVNAPVGINGGDGLDTLVVIGTEFSDDFVITSDGIFGGGLTVSYSGIEILTVNGAEGDDRFFVQSTDENVITTIQGGLGSDSFNIASDTPPIISNDLLGHSGIITHDVTSDDLLYNGMSAEGVSVNVADNDEPGVVITPLMENGNHVIEGILTGAYTVVLTRPPLPGEEVVITAIAPQANQEAFDAGERLLQFISDDIGSNVAVSADGNSVQITFDSTNWNIATQVSYAAIEDGVTEGTQNTVINHTVAGINTADSTSDSVSGTATSATNLITNLVDTDAAFTTADGGLFGGVVEIISGTGVGQQRGITSNTADELSLAFAWNIIPDVTSVYKIILNGEVISSGDSVDSANNRVVLTDNTANFVSEADSGIEGGALRGDTVVITSGTGAGQSALIMSNTDNELVLNKVWNIALDNTSEYEIQRYNQLAIPSVEVQIDEGGPIVLPFPENPAPTPGVQITHSNGSTNVIEGYALGDGVPFTDSYEVVLTSQPTADVIVTVNIENTKTTVGNIFHDEPQVVTDTVELIFTVDNWNIAQSVEVAAIDDNFVDGMDTQVFADIPKVINKIQGPLMLEGEGDSGSEFLFDPLMLPGEINIKPALGEVISATESSVEINPAEIPTEFGNDLTNFTLEITEGTGEGQKHLISFNNAGQISIDGTWGVTPDETSLYTISRTNPNFLVDEAEQVDILTVFNNDSRSDDSGVISANNISGFGMGGDTNIGGLDVTGGINYNDLENVTVNLGFGDDTVDVISTHTRDDGFNAVTILNAGGGDDNINVSLDSQTDGFFVVKGEEGNDTIDASDSSLDIVMFGDEGSDTLTGGSGDDIIFGDLGRVDYFNDDGEVVTRLGLSHDFAKMPDVPTADDETPANQTDGVTRDAGLILSRDTNVGDVDTIVANDGDDIVIGGVSGDVINSGADNDLVFGDNGRIDRTAISSENSTTHLIQTIDALVGGADQINSGSGDDIVLAGAEGDTVFTESGNNIILGDHGFINYDLANNTSTIQTTDLTGGDDVITTGAGDDIILAGAGSDTVSSESGNNTVLGDHGFINADLVNNTSTIQSTDVLSGGDDQITTGAGNDIIIGGTNADTVHAGSGADLIFGDHANITGNIDAFIISGLNTQFSFTSIHTQNSDGGAADSLYGEAGDDIIMGQQGADTIYGGADNDDIIGGHNVSLGHDTGDFLDGGTGADVIAGDNATIDRRDDSSSLRMQTLTGTEIYTENNVNVSGDRAANPDGIEVRDITLLDHADTTSANLYGDDVIAGGADDDSIFGQLGNDTIQGDGSIDINISQTGASVEAQSDGDDYIEGNGGADVIFGNLGQDDIIGGSSNLYGLDSADKRPDGADVIYGGAGTDLARNNLGDQSTEGHARDADVILGDNGNIYRLVGINGIDSGSYLEFNYDDYSAVLNLIPRASMLLDYTPGGAEFDPAALSDRGAGDEIHGESGDDHIYGMTGADVLYGEGQDDDIIGGYGFDWISGGAGQDGVLGDDGRIFTRRIGNGGESLYGVDALDASELDLQISTPGNHQQATINVTGELNKIAHLTPYNLDAAADPNYDAVDADDIIYGGLGSDFIHGGSGDDAISGAEALAVFYNNPSNTGDVLQFGLNDLEEFAAYDENNPRALIDGFLLNFDASEGEVIDNSTPGSAIHNDGNDVIFGDIGNDWIVGGTGEDHLYGGWGNDLLNADDDLSTNNGLNDTTDTHASYDDIAFGGAGRDVLIGNTGGDRLIDWVGEFNSYIVPFAPFGAPTISRSVMPQLMDYLYALSEADGADPTRATDTGSDGTRNGEPNGEPGLVTQRDSAWQDQTGAPADPQPGNIGGGQRDTTDSVALIEPVAVIEPLAVTTTAQDPVYVFDDVSGDLTSIETSGVIGDIASTEVVDYTSQNILNNGNGNGNSNGNSNGKALGVIKGAKGVASVNWNARA